MEVHEAKATTRDVVIIDKRGMTPTGGFILGAVIMIIVVGALGYWMFGDFFDMLRAYNYQ